MLKETIVWPHLNS